MVVLWSAVILVKSLVFITQPAVATLPQLISVIGAIRQGIDQRGIPESCQVPIFPSGVTDHSSMGGNDEVPIHEILVPVRPCPGLPIHKRDFDVSHHYVGSACSQLYLPAGEYELVHENDGWLSDYILQGVTFGFRIVDDQQVIHSYEQENYSSALLGESGDYVNSLILKELSQGLYARSKVRPKCVHALGAVPKPDGSFRPITDCRQPLGGSIYCHMHFTALKFSYNSVDWISEAMTVGCYMSSIDILQAYRTVSVHPDHWTLQGIKWQINGRTEYLMDTRVCFGLRCAPFIFTRLSEFVVRCMHRRGFCRVFQYLDDFI